MDNPLEIQFNTNQDQEGLLSHEFSITEIQELHSNLETHTPDAFSASHTLSLDVKTHFFPNKPTVLPDPKGYITVIIDVLITSVKKQKESKTTKRELYCEFTASYAFYFVVKDLPAYYERSNFQSIGWQSQGILAATAFGTLRGILLSRLQLTALSNSILPVLNAYSDLLGDPGESRNA